MHSNSRIQRSMFAGLVFSLLLTIAGSITAHAQEKSLYERVGGYNALAAVVDDFVGRLVADKQFEKFFAGHSIDSKEAHTPAHPRSVLCGHRWSMRLYRPRHEDDARRSWHH